MYYFSLLFIGLIPFSYLAISDVRVLFFQVLIGCVAVFLYFVKNKKVNTYSKAPIFLIVIFWVLNLFFSITTGYYNELLAVSVFLLLFFITSQLNKDRLKYLVFIYICGAVFSAVGVLVQYVIYNFMGIELFGFNIFGGGRIAYKFLWEDYSFLSLYIVSAIPLLWVGDFDYKFILMAVFLLFCSALTSARTGGVAFIAFCFLYILYILFRGVRTGKLNKKTLILLLLILLAPVVFLFVLEFFNEREVTFSSSGRFDDFLIGYNYFLENPWFGALFNKEFYHTNISVIPHNMFVYILYMGGFVSSLIFLLWFFSIILFANKFHKKIFCSLLICFIGLQFIPSFFAAYFLAILLGMAFLSTKVPIKNKGVINE